MRSGHKSVGSKRSRRNKRATRAEKCPATEQTGREISILEFAEPDHTAGKASLGFCEDGVESRLEIFLAEYVPRGFEFGRLHALACKQQPIGHLS